jgi:uroporphyrinogen decarboxylase
MMRQAGRSDPEYLAYRERVGLSLYELFRSPEHAVPISLLPRRIGVDAIIIYQDILTPLEPLGAVFYFTPGPVLSDPIRSAGQVDQLTAFDPSRRLGFFQTAIQGALRELDGELPLLGFAGGPFTLAAFMIEGKSPPLELPNTLVFLRDQPQAFSKLMDLLTTMTVEYLTFQGAAGAHAVQLFESLGDRVSREIYETHIQPSHQRIFSRLPDSLPSILFVRDSPFPDLMLDSGADAVSLGSKTSLKEIQERARGRIAVQGNVDNRLLVTGTPEEIARATVSCLKETGGQGHILNLSHGLLPETPFENVLSFVRTAREWKAG